MHRPKTSRSEIPSVRQLGLKHPRAAEDLQGLGWNTSNRVPLLWGLATAGAQTSRSTTSYGWYKRSKNWRKPGLTSLFIIRSVLAEVKRSCRRGALFLTLPWLPSWRHLKGMGFPQSTAWTVRCFDDAGRPHRGSPDHMAGTWPGNANWRRHDGDHVAGGGGRSGGQRGVKTKRVYRAGLQGAEADKAMRQAYRSVLARVAAIDCAGTFVLRTTGVRRRRNFRSSDWGGL